MWTSTCTVYGPQYDDSKDIYHDKINQEEKKIENNIEKYLNSINNYDKEYIKKSSL